METGTQTPKTWADLVEEAKRRPRVYVWVNLAPYVCWYIQVSTADVVMLCRYTPTALIPSNVRVKFVEPDMMFIG